MPINDNSKNKAEVLSDDAGTDEDEDAKKDFFESMVYWQ